MQSERLGKYIWIVDTIMSRGPLTRQELSDLWLRSSRTDGHPIPHRTFFTYRREIESIFGIDILCNSAYEYYIESPESLRDEAFQSWMLDSYAVGSAMDAGRAVSSRILVEKVPSARMYLSPLLQAMRENSRITFSYSSFVRPLPEEGIEFEPWFVKLFRQRWYMIGRRVSDSKVRTYALDRIKAFTITDKKFTLPEDLDPDMFFSDLFGITSSHGEVETIRLRTGLHTAKYMRALPLHPTQKEERYSSHSIFVYRMKLTPDLVREILSMGPDVKVLEPEGLRLMVVESLKETLKNYGS